MPHIHSLTSFFVYFLLIISISICQDNGKCSRLTLTTWNIGLEEKQAVERTPLIIKAILNSDADIIGLQEAWGGPQILRTIYQAVKSKYPNFQVVDDNMRSYISDAQLSNQLYSPACPSSDIINFEICFFQNCSGIDQAAQLQCAITICGAQFVPLYTNPICYGCIFDRYISRQDPLGFNYCGAVNLPQLISTSPTITPNSTEAPWNHTIGLMILSTAQYPLQKVKAALFSESYVSLRGYIIVTTNNGQLIFANTHTATVDTPFPHPPARTFFNNTYGSWEEENQGHAAELESNVWNLLKNGNDTSTSAVMLGDYNMGIANFAHNVSDISAQTWNYIHGLKNLDGTLRWYDDYTEKQNLCTGCLDNYVVAFRRQYIYDHIFTHGPLFSSSDLFTKRIYDEFVQIVSNNTNVTTSLSDHYSVKMIITY